MPEPTIERLSHTRGGGPVLSLKNYMEIPPVYVKDLQPGDVVMTSDFPDVLWSLVLNVESGDNESTITFAEPGKIMTALHDTVVEAYRYVPSSWPGDRSWALIKNSPFLDDVGIKGEPTTIEFFDMESRYPDTYLIDEIIACLEQFALGTWVESYNHDVEALLEDLQQIKTDYTDYTPRALEQEFGPWDEVPDRMRQVLTNAIEAVIAEADKLIEEYDGNED